MNLDRQRLLWQLFEKMIDDKLAKMKTEMQTADDGLHRMYGVLDNFDERLAIAETSIRKLIGIDETGEMEGEEDKRRRIETRIDDIQKEQVEMQSKANDIMAIHGNRLAVYWMLYSVSTLMLNMHISCLWSLWLCVWLVGTFMVGLWLQIKVSYFKIKNTGEKRGNLIRQLTKLRAEAQTLSDPLQESSHDITTTPDRQPRRFADRVSTLASELDHSLSAFSCIFLCLLIFPAICLVVVFSGMTYLSYQHCGKAPAHGLRFIWNL